jgi:hypothetical protein
MRKYILYKVLGLAFVVIGMVACDTASQEVEPVISPDGYPVSTIAPVATTVMEGENLVVNITIDKMIERSITFTFVQTGGTADDNDYSVEPATLQPYSKSIQMVFETYVDFDYDASETLVGEIGVYSIADRYLLNPSVENPVDVNFTITNAVSPDLDVSFSWNADVVIDGTTYDAADEIDFDFIVCPEAGFDISDPWATEIGIYDAVTGAHPEEMTLSGLDDGTYLLVADLWYNGLLDIGSGSDGSVNIPIIASFTRQGTSIVDTEVSMNPADMMPDNTPGPDNDPSGLFSAVVAKVTVAGDKYTITKYDDSTIGPFKGVATSSRPAIFRK